ncbi:MAG: HAD family phosphatase [Patescibacteria group bacterium]
MNIRAIGFDYGGVIDDQPPGFMAGIAEILGVPLDELKKVYFHHNSLVNVDGVPYDKFWGIILEKLKKEKKSAEVLKYIASEQKTNIDPKMVELVDRLRTLGYKTGLLSNNSPENWSKIRQDVLGQHFDVVVISAEVGYQKPSSEIFNLFIKKLGVSPSELIFIDDSEQSLRLSQEIGFYPVLFKDYEDLIGRFVSLAILVDRGVQP